MRYLIMISIVSVSFLWIWNDTAKGAGLGENAGQTARGYGIRDQRNDARIVGYGWEAFNDGALHEAEFFFQKALELSPEDVEALYGLSWTYYRLGRNALAAQGFHRLFAKGYRKKECGAALFHLYMRQGLKNKAAEYLPYLSEKERKKYRTSHKRPRNGRSGKKRKASRQFARKGPGDSGKRLERFFELVSSRRWEDAVRAFEALPRPWRKRKDVLTAAGWSFYNAGQTKKASEVFERLLRAYPSDEEAAFGLALSCDRLGRYDCMKKMKEMFPESDRIRKAYCDHIGGLLTRLYDQGAYRELILRYKKDFGIECPEKKQKAAELAAWAAYREHDYRLAHSIFEEALSDGNTSPGVYQGLFASAERAGEVEELWDLASRLSGSMDAKVRKTVADFYHSKGLSRRASRLLVDDGALYANAGSTSVTAGYDYAYLDGDRGTSRLRIQQLPLLGLSFMPSDDYVLSLGLTNLLLQSGPAGASPWIGSPVLGTPGWSPVTSVDAMVPHIGIDIEREWKLRARLSSTPIGGELTPLPLFDLSLEKAGGRSSVTVFQRPVRRSILSWTGQKDPYTGRDWGRVVETGMEARTYFGFGTKGWLSVQGRYGYLWGNDTWKNTKFSGSVAAGRNFRLQDLARGSYGLFATVIHFDRNTNFYTFGHGGYFSPQFFMASGPFCSFTTMEGGAWLLDADLSLAYLDFYEKDSRIYPLSSEPKGTYSADHSSKVGLSVKLSGGWLMTPRLLGTIRLSMDRSGDYTQYGAGVFITFFLKPRKGLLELDLEGMGPYAGGDR